jgi:hypothetical protein
MSTYDASNPRPPQPGEQKTKPAVRQPYQKPSFRFEPVFETKALTCSRLAGECRRSPIAT